jgi:hypothetical protein
MSDRDFQAQDDQDADDVETASTGLLATTTARDSAGMKNASQHCEYRSGGRFDTLRMATVPSLLIRSSTSLLV